MPEPRGPWGSQPGEIGPEPEHVRAGRFGNAGEVSGDRVPPQSVELEMCVLGAIMLEPRDALPIASDFLNRDSFYLDGHGIIFELMHDLAHRGIPPDSTAVLDELRSRQLLDKVGGSGVVMAMLNSVPTAANVEYHSRKVAEKAQLRQLIRGCTETIELAYRQERPLDAIIDYAEGAVGRVSLQANPGQAQHIAAIGDVEYTKILQLRADCDEAHRLGLPLPSTSGFSFGLRDLDTVTGGVQPGMLALVAALPSVGKSGLLCHQGRSLALLETPCAIVSLEMNSRRIWRRLICQLAWTGYTGIRSNDLDTPQYLHKLADWQLERLAKAHEALRKLPIYVVNADANTPRALRAQLRRLKEKRGIKHVGLDYIGLMEDDVSHGDNDVSRLSAVSRKLKLLLEELDLAGTVYSQLNRATHGNDSGKAELQNIRGSGAIEADADMVIFPWRRAYHERSYVPGYPEPEWFEQAPPRERGLAKVQQTFDFWRQEEVQFRIAKNRDGETNVGPGCPKAWMRRAIGRFVDMDHDHRDSSGARPGGFNPPTAPDRASGASSAQHTDDPGLLPRRNMNVKPTSGQGV